jgi:hypothetical protein
LAKDESQMSKEQMLDKAERAERLRERFAELERARQSQGLYEEALEAQRLLHAQTAAALYWRSRAGGETR